MMALVYRGESAERLVFKSELGLVDIIGHFVLWVLLTIVTLGLALFVYPYYLFRFIISKTYVVDADGKKYGRLICSIDLASIIGNVVLWIIITLITFGLAYFIFTYKILAHCMNHTRIVDPTV